MAYDNAAATRASIPTISVKRRGETATGRKYVELKIEKGDVCGSRFFAIDELQKSEGGNVAEWLAELGIPLISRQLKNRLQFELQTQLDACNRPTWPTLVVDDLGWARGTFVTHYQVHKAANESIARAGRVASRVRRGKSSGDRRRMKVLLKTYGKGNPLVRFVVCAGLVGPILGLADVRELPWFVLVGPSSSGKSSLLRLAASIWGGSGSGLLSNLSSLSATTVATEQNGLLARDMLVAYDDLQTLPAERNKRAAKLHDILYQSVTGRERGRYNQTAREWRTVFMSASNDSVATILGGSEVGFSGATSVRCIELPCCGKYGVFSRVPENMKAKKFVDAMVDEASRLPGILGDMFVAKLVRARAADEGTLKARLNTWSEEFWGSLDVDTVDNEQGRVVAKFSLVYAAGCLARQFGILPWKRERILQAVIDVFDQYRASLVRVGAIDPQRKLVDYIKRNRSDFVLVREGRPAKSMRELSVSPGIRFRRANGDVEYCFLPAQLSGVFGGNRALGEACAALVRAGLLIAEGAANRRMRCKRRLVVGGRTRVFCIHKSAVSDQLTAIRAGL